MISFYRKLSLAEKIRLWVSPLNFSKFEKELIRYIASRLDSLESEAFTQQMNLKTIRFTRRTNPQREDVAYSELFIYRTVKQKNKLIKIPPKFSRGSNEYLCEFEVREFEAPFRLQVGLVDGVIFSLEILWRSDSRVTLWGSRALAKTSVKPQEAHNEHYQN